jgi:hypothetical protein
MKYGLMSVLNNQEIAQEQQAQVAATAGADPYARLIVRLCSHLEHCWQAAKDAKAEVEHQMLEDLRQREGVYDPATLALIRQQGGSEIYMQLTNLKCRAFESWMSDVLLPVGERPFYCGPTKVPDLSPDIVDTIAQNVLMEAEQAIAMGLDVTPQQVFERSREKANQARERIKAEAEARADRMEDAIDDMALEGQWYDAMEDMLGDLTALPGGIVKGPVFRNQKRLKWVPQLGGEYVAQAEDELCPVWYSPSPLDIYPAPDSTGPQDGYLFERIAVRHQALHKMIGVPGYKEDAIRAVLDEYSNGYRIDADHQHQRNELEQKRHWEMSPDAGLDMLEFHGSVSGEMLIEWGMEPEKVPDPAAFYEVTAAKVGRHVIRCVLNEDPMGLRPYDIAYFDRIKGAFWGRGLPRVIRDVQEVCNATARALVNNLALASGPMVEVELDRLADGEDATKVHAWRVWQTKSNRTGTPSPAIRWHNVNSNAQELLAVYTYFSQLADTYSGVQSFDHGVNAKSGAASTASGLSMLMNASSRQVKRVVKSVDRVTMGMVKRAHTHIMLHGEDESVKGDVQMEARGAGQLMVREQQQMRRAEFLAATNNPIDMGIIGPLGRAELLREAVKSMDIPVERVVPGRDEMMANIKAEAMAAAQMQIAAEAQGGKPPGGAPTPARSPAPDARQFA